MKAVIVIPPLPKGVLRESVCVSPPLNAPYLAASLREAGHSVSIVDAPPHRLNAKGVAEEVAARRPDFVGITSLTQTYPSSLEVAAEIRRAVPEVPIATGGPHATFCADETFLRSPITIVIRGEGEQTIVDVANRLEAGEDLSGVQGVTYRTPSGQIIANDDRPFIADLDSLPFPAYDLLPLNLYGVLGGRKIFLLQSSRGCPYGCSFCVMYRMDGKHFRARSAKSVSDEIELLKGLKADSFSFCDDIFTLDKKRVGALCDEIISRGLDVPWDCQTRADALDDGVLERMKRAGCQLMCIGVESGSQEILDRMHKRTTVDQNIEAIRKIQAAGIAASSSIIIGYPGETRESFTDSINFVKKAKPDIAFLNIATPFPGTPLFDEIFPNGLQEPSDWQKFDVTTPVFETPTMSKAELSAARREFYNSWYSVGYVLRNLRKRNFYNRTMAWFALTYIRWRLANRAKDAIFRSFR